jgi:cellobiose PTS system EIIA component
VDTEAIAMHLILHGGNARSEAHQAFNSAKEGDLAAAAEALGRARLELRQAHKTQVELIQREASGEGVPPTLLLVHAQDHVMTSQVTVELVEHMIEIIQEMRKPLQ